MIKELTLQLYVFFVKLFFLSKRKNTPNQKVVFVSTFLKNTNRVLPELVRESKKEIVVYNFSNYTLSFPNSRVIIYNDVDFKSHFIMLKDLATASDIIIDNYYPFLGAANVLKGRIIQTWHAVGAFKKFALSDHSLDYRPKMAKKRFKKAYRNIDYVLNGSQKMGDIFKNSFGLNDNKLLNFGMPSSDFYNNQEEINQSKIDLLRNYPLFKNKKIITYAPTYRDNVYNLQKIDLDIEQLMTELGDRYILILRLHPAVKFDDKLIKNQQVINLPSKQSIESILAITDILITDYSSVAFDYSNFNKPIIFYPYDLESYVSNRGLTDNYEKLVSGNIVYSTEEIIQVIQKKAFKMEDIEHFRHKWNEFSNGNNTQLLVEMIK